MTHAKNINLSINYQEGSVVSKEIINKPNGLITLFAFDKDQGLSEHTAPYDVFMTITEGFAEILVSNIKYKIKAGEMLFVPANASHSLKAIQSFKMILTMIKSQYKQ